MNTPRPYYYVLGRGYVEARTDTTQQSGQTPDKEVDINIHGNECGKNKSNENFKTTITSKNYDRPKTTRECGIF
jgi:hypothetical protein